VHRLVGDAGSSFDTMMAGYTQWALVWFEYPSCHALSAVRSGFCQQREQEAAAFGKALGHFLHVATKFLVCKIHDVFGKIAQSSISEARQF
jgi:hypothetical protein